MTARQLQNPRWGNIAEVAAQSYLMPFAFVCPVPRPDDVGFDFLCTLSERLGLSAYAKQSFLVQSKSSSVTELKLETEKGHLHWLARLELPLFFVSIDLLAAKAELYWISHAIHEVWAESIREYPAVTLTIHFGERSLENDTAGLDGKRYSSRHQGGHFHIWLGQPLLSWHATELQNEKFYERAYSVLSCAINHHRESWDDYSMGIFSGFDWVTNSPPRKSDRAHFAPAFRQDSAKRAFENGYRILEVLARDLVESPTSLLPQKYPQRSLVLRGLLDWAQEVTAELPSSVTIQASLSNNPMIVALKREARIKQVQVWAVQIKGWIEADRERFRSNPEMFELIAKSKQVDLDLLLAELRMHGQQYADQVLNDSSLSGEVERLVLSQSSHIGNSAGTQ